MKRWTILWNIAAVVTLVGVFMALADLLRHKTVTKQSTTAPVVLTMLPMQTPQPAYDVMDNEY